MNFLQQLNLSYIYHALSSPFFMTSSMFNFRSSLLHNNPQCWFFPRSGQTSTVQHQAKNSLLSNSLINFPAIVSHDYSAISLALANIFCPKKLSIQCKYLAVARFDSQQQQRIGLSIIIQSKSKCDLKICCWPEHPN